MKYIHFLILCLGILAGCSTSKDNVNTPPSVESPPKPSHSLDPGYDTQGSVSGQAIIKAKDRKVGTENEDGLPD